MLQVGTEYYLQVFHDPNTNMGQEVCLHTTCEDMVFLSGSVNYNKDTESMNWIKSNQLLMPNSIVDYDAVDSIILLPNFEVELGSRFHAFIDGCNGAMLREENEILFKK